MTNVKPYHLSIKNYNHSAEVYEKNVKLKGQRVEVMVSNERSCHKEYTCEI
jgi:hypothetical protein